MAVKPILFSAPMVRALLAGTKSQTRRILKPQPVADGDGIWRWEAFGAGVFGARDGELAEFAADLTPYAVGDVLWVRETWAHYQTVNHVRRTHGGAFSEVSDGLAGYRADGHDTIEDFRSHIRLMSGSDLEEVVINGDRWRHARFMPRWASRLTLVVTDVRVQRLQDISEEDAIAEGVGAVSVAEVPRPSAWSARHDFSRIWSRINGDGSWEANPWIAAYTFETYQMNVEQFLRSREAA